MNYIKNLVFKIINNSIKLSENKNSIKFLNTVSFLESIVFPIPPDIFLIPIVLAKKKKWLYLSLLCTFFSVLGGIIGYVIGFFFWDLLGSHIIEFYNANEELEKLQTQFSKYGWYIILLAGFTPLPYKVITLSSGFLSFNFLIFLICSLISRSLRFIIIAYLVKKYGDRGLLMIKQHFYKVTTLILLLSVIFLYIIIK